MKEVNTILIPAADVKQESKELLDNLLTSIVNGYTDKEFNVVISFDCCTEEFVEYFTDKHSFIIAIDNHVRRLRFAKNVNKGLRFIHKQFNSNILVVNMDTLLPHVNYVKQISGEGLVTPVTQDIKDDLDKLQPKTVTRRLLNNKFPFYCVFINKNVLDKIGYLNENYLTHEDDEYIVRTLLAGFTCEEVSVIVNHLGSHHDTNSTGESKSGCYNLYDLGINHMKYRRQWKVPNKLINDNGFVRVATKEEILKLKDQNDHDLIIPWIMNNYVWTNEMKIY